MMELHQRSPGSSRDVVEGMTRKPVVLVVGGTGFVGSEILKLAVEKGISVRSLNPSGRPNWSGCPWIDEVEWIQGDVFRPSDVVKALKGATGVISTVGAFGSNEYMQKMCGDASIEVARIAQSAGVQFFVFVSESHVGTKFPSWSPIFGYFDGKMRAENAVSTLFPKYGVSLRPGFVYGSRRVNVYGWNLFLPLQLVGAPVAIAARQLGPISWMMGKLPFLGHEINAVCGVGDLEKAALVCSISSVDKHALETPDIISVGENLDKIIKKLDGHLKSTG